jgi:hypothetical protein
MEALKSVRTNLITGVGIEKCREVVVLRCPGTCGKAAAMKGVRVKCTEAEAEGIMIQHYLLHHPEWCRTKGSATPCGNKTARTHAPHIEVNAADDTEQFALFADRPKLYTEYAGVVRIGKSDRHTFQARCTYCAKRQQKNGQVLIPGACGYRTDVEAAIAFGKHVHVEHEAAFDVLDIRSKKAKFWKDHHPET